jgi:hypothetical protein
MLVRTTSCDGGMRVDLWCDECGRAYDPTDVDRHSRRLLWAAARADGWQESVAATVARQRCPACAAEMAGRAGQRRDDVTPVG